MAKNIFLRSNFFNYSQAVRCIKCSLFLQAKNILHLSFEKGILFAYYYYETYCYG
jgi:hypothetical protein